MDINTAAMIDGYKIPAEVTRLDEIQKALPGFHSAASGVALPEDIGERLLSAKPGDVESLVLEAAMYAASSQVRNQVISAFARKLEVETGRLLNLDRAKIYKQAADNFNAQASTVNELAPKVRAEVLANQAAGRDEDEVTAAFRLSRATTKLATLAAAVRGVWSARNDTAQFLGLQTGSDDAQRASSTLRLDVLRQELPLFSAEAAVALAAAGVSYSAPDTTEKVLGLTRQPEK